MRKVKFGCFSAHVREVLCWTRLSRQFSKRLRRVSSDLRNQARMEIPKWDTHAIHPWLAVWWCFAAINQPPRECSRVAYLTMFNIIHGPS